MTNIRDFVHNLSGRTSWHGDNDIELQPAQWGFGEAGTALIVAPFDKVLKFRIVETDATGAWVGGLFSERESGVVTLGPGKKGKYTAPGWPHALRLFEAELHADKGGAVDGTTYIPVVDDVADWAAGIGKDYQWVVWMVAAIIIIIIVVGLYIAAAKATRGG
jgi:hypothetical protein